MRLNPIPATLFTTATAAGQHALARPAAGIGRRRAIWSALHLLGAGLFVLAMITHLAQARPNSAPTPIGTGAAISPSPEWPSPSDPHKI
ncbi:hypothetical protein [Roseicyclus mahoneyensis]|jgi:hypothetical protein|uniref:Uncharacterized protein n=1 Tax=Roseicyclus mahoneyensis TaxID=164332 RepID=A0A316GW48_9RHOB|nr:hypothetical protein [Roseicyclus mahoneyensis]PWK59307.1 hypothetical protein C7455_10875 [Roseicyclus mahoneyensis]